jgi:hypothetical protein
MLVEHFEKIALSGQQLAKQHGDSIRMKYEIAVTKKRQTREFYPAQTGFLTFVGLAYCGKPESMRYSLAVLH